MTPNREFNSEKKSVQLYRCRISSRIQLANLEIRISAQKIARVGKVKVRNRIPDFSGSRISEIDCYKLLKPRKSMQMEGKRSPKVSEENQ